MLKKTKKRNRLYTPLKMFLFYICITLFMSFFGPWKYINYNKIYVSLYMLIFLIAVISTYSLFVKTNKSISIVFDNIGKESKINGVTIAEYSILFGFLLMLIILSIKIYDFGVPNFNDIFLQMAKAYTNKGVISNRFNLSAWIFGYFSIFYFTSLVLGTYYYSVISYRYKILFFFIVIMSLTYHILFVGNQKAIADLFIYISSALFAKFAQSGKKINIKKAMISLIVIISIFFLFSSILQNRMTYWNVEYYSKGDRAFLDFDHWMLYLINDNIKLGFATFIYYLSHGYYGLSLSLEMPFVWSKGYGSSFDIKYLFNKIYFLTDQEIGSYPVRVEIDNGWEAYSNWQTIFPWLASDFTFWGAIIIICIFIAVYAVSWNRILRKGHWINLLMFTNINVMLLYIPANNQLFQTRASLVVTLIITLIWVFKYNNLGSEL